MAAKKMRRGSQSRFWLSETSVICGHRNIMASSIRRVVSDRWISLQVFVNTVSWICLSLKCTVSYLVSCVHFSSLANISVIQPRNWLNHPVNTVQMSKWKIHKLFITSHLLKIICLNYLGKIYEVMKMLRDIWEDSNYQKSRKGLMICFGYSWNLYSSLQDLG